MNLRRIRLLALSILIVLLSLIGLQLYWIDSSIRLRSELFNQNVKSALEASSLQIENLETFDYISQHMRKKRQKIQIDIAKQKADTFAFPDSFTIMDSLIFRKNGKNVSIVIDSMQPDNYLTDADTLRNKDSLIILKFKNEKNQQLKVQVNTDKLMDYTKSYVDSLQYVIQKRSDIIENILTDMMEMSLKIKPGFYISKDTLRDKIEVELQKKGINIPFEIAVFKPNGEMEYTTASDTNLVINSPYGVALHQLNIMQEPYYLKVYFPEKESFILSSMGKSLLLSIFLIIILMTIFYIVISSIIRQKKLADIKNDFVNNMTHELKTPVSSISLASEALHDDAIASNRMQSERFLKVIQEETGRLSGLIDNVLENALNDKEQFAINFKEHSLAEIIEKSISRIRLKAEKNMGQIMFQNNAGEAKLMADDLHLGNALLNIFDNAIKYSEKAPLIYVNLDKKEDKYIVRIQDNGIGIKKDQLKKIFDKFYRVPTGNIHNIKGFGLGLNYVKKVVIKHHGSIVAKSEPGSGTTFIIELPEN